MEHVLNNISTHTLWDETECVQHLLPLAEPFLDSREAIYTRAKKYVKHIRNNISNKSIETFISEYSLNSKEGVMIMCLAEALLRIPDKSTADALIKDKIQTSNWKSHLDADQSIFINAATWGLILTGEVLSLEQTPKDVSSTIQHLISRMSEPIIRTIIQKAMHLLGTEFVIGQTINSALEEAKKLQKRGYLLSYDMLGEAACTQSQTDDFYQSYFDAITEIGNVNEHNKPLHSQPSLSIKLSALHPRYEWLKREQVQNILLPRLKKIFLHARNNHIAVTIDAEEASSLDLSLLLFSQIIHDEDFKNYDGIGFVVQAYQKRATFVIQHLINLSKKHKRIIPIRLVKGAYWDSEIKWAQESGLDGYPVFTRKSHTDLSFFACARLMLNNIDQIYPQFATHNALTVAGILEVAESQNIADSQFEFQRLYGMGETFYNQMIGKRNIRIYAPIGQYNELLPYLIRRLLENGANTSFVNLSLDESEPLSKILYNPVQKAKKLGGEANSDIPLPKNLYDNRVNSTGHDLGNRKDAAVLAENFLRYQDKTWHAQSIIYDWSQHQKKIKCYSPHNPKQYIGTYSSSSNSAVKHAIDQAKKHFPSWNQTPLKERCACISDFADLLIEHRNELIALLVKEAGKTIKDALAEIREAEDFCRYYTSITSLHPKKLQGPTGESNQLTYEGKGVFSCISPWNFPLAIFTGQIVAALVAGNSVIAKPASQTPLIASFAISLMHQAGIPVGNLQLVIGSGRTVGEALINSPNIAGVAFTGSTEIAQHINISLAKRNSPIAQFIAETGGQNCMIIDSSVQPEQAVNDIIHSAFGSAGQRCSALRIAFVQEDIADRIIELLSGTMAELIVGSPEDFSTDIGPVIDKKSQKTLQKHLTLMTKTATLIGNASAPKNNGHFIAPHAFEIDSMNQLEGEVFGPILHLIRYSAHELPIIIEQINNYGYGLTCGIHSRINTRIDYIKDHIRAGNIYINRSMTGATVGVQPFGGIGLSGTGPKAGGPHYLHAFSIEKTITNNTACIGGDVELLK